MKCCQQMELMKRCQSVSMSECQYVRVSVCLEQPPIYRILLMVRVNLIKLINFRCAKRQPQVRQLTAVGHCPSRSIDGILPYDLCDNPADGEQCPNAGSCCHSSVNGWHSKAATTLITIIQCPQ